MKEKKAIAKGKLNAAFDMKVFFMEESYLAYDTNLPKDCFVIRECIIDCKSYHFSKIIFR